MKFTIITVCLNSVDTIERTIKSVLNQNNAKIEYIIVDGGSQDGTLDIIRSYSENITYWCSEQDNGIYDAMNKGIARATGDIISFLNSSDWYEQGIFEAIQNEFEKGKSDIVCGRLRYIKNDHIIGESSCVKSEKDIYVQMIYSHPAMFVKKALFEQYGVFDTNYKICADYDWLLRVYNKGANISFIDCVCTNFSLGGISSKKECADETREVCVKNLPEQKYDQYYSRILEMYIQNRNLCVCSEVVLKIKNGIFNSGKYRIALQKFAIESECNLFGFGLRAHDCLDILDVLNIKVRHIYDNNINKQGIKIGDLVIESKKEIDNTLPVIITSVKYETEIEEELKELNVLQIVRFTDMIKEIFKIYEKEI